MRSKPLRRGATDSAQSRTVIAPRLPRRRAVRPARQPRRVHTADAEADHRHAVSVHGRPGEHAVQCGEIIPDAHRQRRQSHRIAGTVERNEIPHWTTAAGCGEACSGMATK